MQIARLVLATLGGAFSFVAASSTLVHANELLPTTIRYKTHGSLSGLEQTFLSSSTLKYF